MSDGRPQLAVLTEPLQLSEADFRLFQGLARKLAGVHLPANKSQLVRARLMKRILRLKLRSFRAYYRYLTRGEGREQGELQEFLHVITTHTTRFFREDVHFELLKTLFQEHDWYRQPELRILCAGCSTGEEAYSVALVAYETLGETATGRVSIEAGDLSHTVLKVAKQGVYELEKLEGVPRELLEKHFLRGTGGRSGFVQAGSHLKQIISFRFLNLIGSFPAQLRFHVVFCRNVGIYFDRSAQKAIYERLFSALHPRGYLFLGLTEGLTSLRGLPAYTQVQPSAYRLDT